MTPKRIAGQVMKRAILSSTFLPDRPAIFRRQQAALALTNDGHVFADTTLDTQLLKLCQQGFLERAMSGGWYWYRFAKTDRTSDRPDYGPGERRDPWTSTESTSSE